MPRDLSQHFAQECDSPTSNSVTQRDKGLTPEGFLEQPVERLERRDMESKLFAYMLARYKLPSRLVMKDFNTLYTNSKCKDRVPSNIHYLELLDEHPDSVDTM